MEDMGNYGYTLFRAIPWEGSPCIQMTDRGESYELIRQIL